MQGKICSIEAGLVYLQQQTLNSNVNSCDCSMRSLPAYQLKMTWALTLDFDYGFGYCW